MPLLFFFWCGLIVFREPHVLPVQGMWARLQEVEATVNAGVLIEDAEEMVAQYAAVAAEMAGGGAQERSTRPSDEEIAEIVEARQELIFL